nr:MAG TPA: hypothetical protein [Caudoviricetes sp.]
MLCRFWTLDIKTNKYGMHSQAELVSARHTARRAL